MNTSPQPPNNSGHEPVDCQVARENLSAFLDGELSGPRTLETPSPEAIEEHLKTCQDCQAVRNELEQDWNLLGAWPTPSDLDSSTDFLSRVNLRLESERRYSRIRTLSMAAAAIVLVAVLWPMINTISNSQVDDVTAELASIEVENEVIEGLTEVVESFSKDELALLVDMLPDSEDSTASAGPSTSQKEADFNAMLDQFLVEELEGERS